MMPPDRTLCDLLAHTHARAFVGVSRGWSAEEFATLLASPFINFVGDKNSFALIRVVADEAELLTIATDPDHRRQGRAANCLAQGVAMAKHHRAAHIFLDVAADNHAAIAMYAASGFSQTGRRVGYYKRPAAEPVDAVLMKLSLA